MSTKLLKVDRSELTFTFELGKKSSCPIQLVNDSDHYVAFKVKTTSPKRYSVRPNISIIKPTLTCEVIVTLEAGSVAPPDMHCKDKFLIQSIIVSFGTTEEAVRPSMFTKNDGNDVEEHKLRVVLITPPCYPISQPVFGDLEQELAFESPIWKNRKSTGMKEFSFPPMYTAEDKELKLSKDIWELKIPNNVEDLITGKDVEEMRIPHGVDEITLAKDIEELKLRIDNLDAKLHEVEIRYARLSGESSKERQILDIQRDMLRKGICLREVREGFSIVSVGLMAISGVVLGYLIKYP